MDDHTINITLRNGKVNAEKANPLGVNPGDRVIWRFQGDAAGKGLQVKLRDCNLIDELKPGEPEEPDVVIGTISSNITEGTCEYDIFMKLEKLQWENGVNGGGCIKTPPPPGGGQRPQGQTGAD